MSPQADILNATATWLADVMSVPVYYPDLPRSLVESPPRTKMLIITPGGSMQSAGDRSYARIARARADIRCYGETGKQAMDVYLELAGFLKDLRPRVVNIGPGDDSFGVRIDNAILSNGPLKVIDPDTDESVIYATWGVHGSESVVGAVEAGAVNSILMAEHQLTHAELVNLVASPIEIVPAPGVGRFIDVIGVVTVRDFAQGYGVIGTAPELSNGSASTHLITAWDEAGAIEVHGVTNSVDDLSTLGAGGGNDPIVVLNDGTDLTGGDPANTFSIRIYYRIEPYEPFGA